MDPRVTGRTSVGVFDLLQHIFDILRSLYRPTRLSSFGLLRHLYNYHNFSTDASAGFHDVTTVVVQ